MRQSHAGIMLPIIQAWASGKNIQVKRSCGTWLDVDPIDGDLYFDRPPDCYRIKPEPPKPQRLWVVTYPDKSQNLFTTQEEALREAEYFNYETTSVKEFLEVVK